MDLFLKNLNIKSLFKNICYLINKKIKIRITKKSIKNFYLTHKIVSNNIDTYRDEKMKFSKLFSVKRNLSWNLVGQILMKDMMEDFF